ncbi:SecY-interacting protein [Shewanella maritima]|uniref:SecY-interacting protein n=1 Tax=Shewanella maritima TaxID=2520507 RepID=UPI003735EBF1
MSCSSALDNFIQRYLKAYDNALSELPRYYPLGEASPCIEGEQELTHDTAVFWQPVKRQNSGGFDNVAQALEMTLHDDINAFFGRYYCAPLSFDSEWGEGELLQAWNQQDFEYLQQNIIGHLMMKQKLKQPATWFIGVIADGDQMITVDNETGSVWLEIPGDKPKTQLAESLADFLPKLNVVVKPAIMPQAEQDVIASHPGIWQRIKGMWASLMGHNKF